MVFGRLKNVTILLVFLKIVAIITRFCCKILFYVCILGTCVLLWQRHATYASVTISDVKFGGASKDESTTVGLMADLMQVLKNRNQK